MVLLGIQHGGVSTDLWDGGVSMVTIIPDPIAKRALSGDFV